MPSFFDRLKSWAATSDNSPFRSYFTKSYKEMIEENLIFSHYKKTMAELEIIHRSNVGVIIKNTNELTFGKVYKEFFLPGGLGFYEKHYPQKHEYAIKEAIKKCFEDIPANLIIKHIEQNKIKRAKNNPQKSPYMKVECNMYDLDFMVKFMNAITDKYGKNESFKLLKHLNESKDIETDCLNIMSDISKINKNTSTNTVPKEESIEREKKQVPKEESIEKEKKQVPKEVQLDLFEDIEKTQAQLELLEQFKEAGLKGAVSSNNQGVKDAIESIRKKAGSAKCTLSEGRGSPTV